MAERTFRVKLPERSVVTGTLILRLATPEEKRDFLRHRYEPEGMTLEVREQFLDRMLVGAEDLRELGEPVDLSHPGWRAVVPLESKLSAVQLWYEEPVLTRADEKKSETPPTS